MKLTLEQIKAAARGAAYVTEEAGRVRLHRFTAAQEALYRQANAEHYARSFATAGVVLEFDTDSVYLKLAIQARKGSSRHWFVHSVFVDGRRIGELRGKFAPPETADAEARWPLGAGTKRVKILFPWSAGSEIRALELDDGASFVPVKKGKRVLIFGDSITQGYDAALPENAYASQLAEFLDADCINKAIGGEVFRTALGELADDFVPDLITVAYGTNDWSGKKKEELEENSFGFCRNLRKSYPNTKIVLLAPVWRDNWQAEKPAGDFRAIPGLFARIADEIGNAAVIDCFGFIPQDPACFSPDVLHPNDTGFHHYAEGLRNSKFKMNG